MSAKNKASIIKRRPAVAKRRGQETRAERVEATGSQAAAAKRAAEAELTTLIDKHAPTHQRLISAMRRLLRKRLPTAFEIVYEYDNLGAVVISFSPSEQGYEGVLALRATAEGVKLYFTQGKDLPDPEKLLQGSANARWISVEAAATLKHPEVVSLIDEALARNRVPFASSGRGAVMIQSTSTKKGKRSRPA
jgi:hypothetical protein